MAADGPLGAWTLRCRRGCLLPSVFGVASLARRYASSQVVAVGLAVEVVHFGRMAGAMLVSQSAAMLVSFKYFGADLSPLARRAARPCLAHDRWIKLFGGSLTMLEKSNVDAAVGASNAKGAMYPSALFNTTLENATS